MKRKADRPNIEPPPDLDEQARQKWAEVLPILDGRGDVHQGTLDALAAYSQAWSRWTAAEAQVSTLGPVIKGAAGLAVPNPFVAIAAAAQRQMRQWAVELQLTPKSKSSPKSAPRTAGSKPAPPAEKSNAFANLRIAR